MSIFDTLNRLSDNQRKKLETLNVSTTKRKDPSYIYLEDNQIKETKISELLDSAGSAYINRVMNYNSARLIHDSLFGKY